MSGMIAKTENGKSTVVFMIDKRDYLQKRNDIQTYNEESFNAWMRDNEADLWDTYLEYVTNLADSWEHKNLMLRKEQCFKEWCEEIFYE